MSFCSHKKVIDEDSEEFNRSMSNIIFTRSKSELNDLMMETIDKKDNFLL